ncbi:hypothetical protein [Candidatus Trichorickettsia mobilis]|uniref:hypothetical protein n=1 Tax=Candidatus Trichorickettsia mobilis TaxID=1346319 RepID=UPI00292D3C42|nr:hypothetical protein [Candidatus Trichorickettsia mobilis]
MKTTHGQYKQIILNYNFIKDQYNILKHNVAWLTLEVLEHNEHIDLTTIIDNTAQTVSHVRNKMLALIQKQQIESLTLEETRFIFNLSKFLEPPSNVYTNISSLINLVLESNSVNRQVILQETSILYQSIEGLNSYYTYSEGILFHLLNHAITHDNNNIIDILLTYGANPFQCNNNGYSAFYNTLSLFAADKEIIAKKFLHLQLKQKSLTMTEFAYNNIRTELENNIGANFFSYLAHQFSCKHSKFAEICGFNNITHKIHFEHVQQLARHSSKSLEESLKIKNLTLEDKLAPCNELKSDELLYSYYSSLYNKLHHMFNTAGVITSQQLLISTNIPISMKALFAVLDFIVPNSGKVIKAISTTAKSNIINADTAKLMKFILDPDKLHEVLKTTAEKITIWKKQEIEYIATHDNKEIACWKYQSLSDKIDKIFKVDINRKIYETNPLILGYIDALKVIYAITKDNIYVDKKSTESIATQLANSISKYTYTTDHLITPNINEMEYSSHNIAACNIFSVIEIVYDNILLNYPKLLKKFSNYHDNKVTSQLISLMSQLSINCKDFVEEICDNENLQALELLMGIDSNVHQEMNSFPG